MAACRKAVQDRAMDPLTVDLNIDPDYRATKTLTQLLAEGHPHKGGLAQLASAEQTAGQPRAAEGPSSHGAGHGRGQ
jgi:hypothetical protein